MSRVAVDNLKEGLVLSEDVRDINGRLILSKGRQLAGDHIRILKIWGIPEVGITDGLKDAAPAGPARTPRDADKLSRVEQTVKTVLQHIATDASGVDEICRAAVDYRYRNGLILEFGPRQPLPAAFKLDLGGSIRTQIEFSELKLPEVPEILLDVIRIVEDPFASIRDIADVVSRSPSLAARLLQIVNSAFYGLTSKVDTISRAVTMLGVREVNTLIMGIGVMRLFHGIPKGLIDMPTFLRHSLACGLLSRILGAHKQVPRTERLFVSGLLHDIGRLMLFKYFPEQTKLLLEMARKTGISVYDLEDESLGITHAQVAGHMLRKWKLPGTLENIIVHHHSPSDSPEPLEACLVHVADIAVNALGIGHSGEYIIPRFEAPLWDQIGIAPGILGSAIAQTVQQVGIMQKLFPEFSR